MPHPHLYAVRDNLDLREKEARRAVAALAVDDITNRSRPRFQWSHPHMARLLGVAPAFTSMVANYLDYRKNQLKASTERGIRPYQSSSAQLFQYEGNIPLDLLNLGTSGDRTEQMAKLLMEATARKIRVDPATVQDIENMLSRACGMAWPTVVDTVQRQRIAQLDVIATTTKTTTAMGVKAA